MSTNEEKTNNYLFYYYNIVSKYLIQSPYENKKYHI